MICGKIGGSETGMVWNNANHLSNVKLRHAVSLPISKKVSFTSAFENQKKKTPLEFQLPAKC
jgi:hypothetical protein